MPFLVKLSKVPDVRVILGVVTKNNEMDLNLAEEMATRILNEQRAERSKGSRKTIGGLQRTSNLNSEDFDLNDRTTDPDLTNFMEQPFSKAREEQNLRASAQEHKVRKRPSGNNVSSS